MGRKPKKKGPYELTYEELIERIQEYHVAIWKLESDIFDSLPHTSARNICMALLEAARECRKEVEELKLIIKVSS